MSEARTPEEETIDPREEREPATSEDDHTGPDPEEDAKGDGSDEDQGT